MKEINLKSSTIEKSLDLAKDFLQTLIGPSVGELGQFFADKVKVWRLKNQINTLGKVQKIIKEKNIKPQQVNLKILLPYLDAVSLEEDEKLQDIWANLLVNYVDSSKNLTSVVYPQILKQLSSKEIEVLEFMENQVVKYQTKTVRFSFIEKYKLQDFTNLTRLGIIMNPSYNPYTTNPHRLDNMNTGFFITSFTDFGLEFYKACQKDD